MKSLLLCLIAGFLLQGQEPPPAEGPKKLTPDQIKEAIAADKDLVLLDVREPKELVELGTLKGYVNVPLSELEKRLSEIPKDRKLMVFCNRAARAAKAAAILKQNGHDNIIGLGAMNDWKEKQYEVVYPEKEPPARQ